MKVINLAKIDFAGGGSPVPPTPPVPTPPDYLCFTAEEDSDLTLTMPAGLGTDLYEYVEFSTDGGDTWNRTSNVDDEEVVASVSVLQGDSVLVRGLGTAMCKGDTEEYTMFAMTGRMAASGNIMSLLHPTNFASMDTVSDYAFYYLFYGCDLTTAPALPAVNLGKSCYEGIFSACALLTEGVSLPALVMAESCYMSMYEDCVALETPSILSSVTLARRCYDNMYYGCKALTSAPILPATVLSEECYAYIFHDCENLESIMMLATDISATDCLTAWVDGVAAEGIFVKAAAMTNLPTGNSGIPAGWTVEDYEP